MQIDFSKLTQPLLAGIRNGSIDSISIDGVNIMGLSIFKLESAVPTHQPVLVALEEVALSVCHAICARDGGKPCAKACDECVDQAGFHAKAWGMPYVE